MELHNSRAKVLECDELDLLDWYGEWLLLSDVSRRQILDSLKQHLQSVECENV